MKKRLCGLLPICLICLFLIAADGYMTLTEAQEFAEGLYSKTGEIVNVTKKMSIFDDDYERIFGKDKNGHAIYKTVQKKYPNDMYILNVSGARQVSAQALFGNLVDFVKANNNVQYRWKTIGTRYCKQPEMTNGADTKELALVIIQKEWMVNGNRIIIIDSVEVDLKYKNIALIHNCVVPLQSAPEEILEEMKAKAAGLYDRACKLDKWYRFGKRREAIPFYNEAFTLYEKIAERDSNMAYYHMGVMYFKGQGNGMNMSKKQRLQKAYECWKKSDLKKARRAISYITDGRE